MINKKTLRHNIRERWLEALFEFAHLEYQRRLWIEADYPGYVGDSGEAFCQYFNDLDLENGYDKFLKNGFVSQLEVDIVSDFHHQLDCYISRPEKQSLADKKILKDIEWLNLTEIAKTNWEKLKSIIGDKSELKYMDSLETKFLK